MPYEHSSLLHPGVHTPPYPIPDLLLGTRMDVHPEHPDLFQVILLDDDIPKDQTVLCEGSWPTCEHERLSWLQERYGAGTTNLPLPTLGGKQLWRDIFVERGWRIQQHIRLDSHRLLNPANRRQAAGNYAQCRIAYEIERFRAGGRRHSEHAVCILHGLIRAKESMRSISATFWEAGFEVIDINYPSTRRALEEHADQLRTILRNTRPFKRVSFVTHSMGAMVVRTALAACTPAQDPWLETTQIHRLMMIFPPSRGASKADRWHKRSIAQAIMGPALTELTTHNATDIPRPTCKFGIIAGSRDTTVLVHEAALHGAEDFAVFNAHHTFGMQDPAIIQAALSYINTGSLQPSPDENPT